VTDEIGDAVVPSTINWSHLGLASMWATSEATLALVAHPSLAVAVAAAGPLALGAVDELLERSHDRRRAKAAACLAVASNQSGRPVDELMARLDSPARELLAELALDASCTTATLEKVLALGCALAEGLNADEATLDEISMIVRALGDLEVPHIRILDFLAGGPRTLGHPEGVPGHRASAEASPMGIQVRAEAFTRREIEMTFPSYAVALDGVLAVLLRHGLIVERPGDIVRAMQQGQRLQNLSGGRRGGIPSSAQLPPSRFQLTALGIGTLEYLWAAMDGEEHESQRVE
jgi:hypothetical protein